MVLKLEPPNLTLYPHEVRLPCIVAQFDPPPPYSGPEHAHIITVLKNMLQNSTLYNLETFWAWWHKALLKAILYKESVADTERGICSFTGWLINRLRIRPDNPNVLEL